MRLISRIDRQVAAGLGLVGVCSLFLIAGIVSVLIALGDDGADLPDEGSIEAILNDAGGPDAALAPDAATLLGPAPVRLAVPELYIDAPVVTLGVDEQNVPLTPDRGDLVAWYNFRASPGRSSNAVFSGHVDWQTRNGQPIPGVFYRLRELQTGNTVVITLEDGVQLKYRVTGNVALNYDDPDIVRAMDLTAKDVVTLITCGGSWIRDAREQYGGSYSHRVVVRAERVIDEIEAPASGG